MVVLSIEGSHVGEVESKNICSYLEAFLIRQVGKLAVKRSKLDKRGTTFLNDPKNSYLKRFSPDDLTITDTSSGVNLLVDLGIASRKALAAIRKARRTINEFAGSLEPGEIFSSQKDYVFSRSLAKMDLAIKLLDKEVVRRPKCLKKDDPALVAFIAKVKSIPNPPVALLNIGDALIFEVMPGENEYRVSIVFKEFIVDLVSNDNFAMRSHAKYDIYLKGGMKTRDLLNFILRSDLRVAKQNRETDLYSWLRCYISESDSNTTIVKLLNYYKYWDPNKYYGEFEDVYGDVLFELESSSFIALSDQSEQDKRMRTDIIDFFETGKVINTAEMKEWFIEMKERMKEKIKKQNAEFLASKFRSRVEMSGGKTNFIIDGISS